MTAVHRSLLAVAITGLVLLYGGPADAVPVKCGTAVNGLICGGIVAEDSVDWGQLGPKGTTFPDIDGNNPPPLTAFSNSGDIVVKLNDPGGFFARRDQNPVIGDPFKSPYEGNFDGNAHLLLNGVVDPAGPVTIDFLSKNGGRIAVLGAGFRLQMNPFGTVGAHNPFTVLIQAFEFDAVHNQFNELASFFNPNGDSCVANDDPSQLDCPFGSALFVGVGAPENPNNPPAPRISRIIVDVRNGQADGTSALDLPAVDFAFDGLLIGAVPEPASIVLVGVGLIAVALGTRRRSRR